MYNMGCSTPMRAAYNFTALEEPEALAAAFRAFCWKLW
jgi:hypothetical protein